MTAAFAHLLVVDNVGIAALDLREEQGEDGASNAAAEEDYRNAGGRQRL